VDGVVVTIVRAPGSSAVPPNKLYKFAAAAVMSTVAVATVVTFTSSDQAGSSPVSALPRVPGANAAAPSVGINETPTASPSPTTEQPTTEPKPSPSQSPTTSSRSTTRDNTSSRTPTAKPRDPSPSPSPTHPRPLRDLLEGLFGG
jgi:hypothetical protein